MIQVQLVVQQKEKGLDFGINILSREDVTSQETRIALKMQDVLLKTIRRAAKKAHYKEVNFTKIGDDN